MKEVIKAMCEYQPQTNAARCDSCGCQVGPQWYQIQVEEWLYPECKSQSGYVICNRCFPQLAEIIWRHQALEAFSEWVEDQTTID